MWIFQSTRPVRGRDKSAFPFSLVPIHFNPRAPCGGATGGRNFFPPFGVISIHAPRAGARLAGTSESHTHRTYFNPRAPCGGATNLIHETTVTKIFQSTRPVRGRDLMLMMLPLFVTLFQSTRPVRGRDPDVTIPVATAGISIHAPRAGARLRFSCFTPHRPGYFNPRAPCGGATLSGEKLTKKSGNFNPRAPCGGATDVNDATAVRNFISIHAPRAGARPRRAPADSSPGIFQSTRPVRGRDPGLSGEQGAQKYFNPRAPCGGATQSD